MISGFIKEINQWLVVYPLGTSKDLDEMEKFIKGHILQITKEDAQFYLPVLKARVNKIQDDHPLIKEIQNIQDSLLSPDAKTIEVLPQEILLIIL